MWTVAHGWAQPWARPRNLALGWPGTPGSTQSTGRLNGRVQGGERQGTWWNCLSLARGSAQIGSELGSELQRKVVRCRVWSRQTLLN